MARMKTGPTCPCYPCNPWLRCGLVLLVAVATRSNADTAIGLSSFEAIEEPLVQFHPASGRFTPDSFVNITEVGQATFRFTNRFNADWWDGDRDTLNRDRQRAEVKGLGPHTRHGQTLIYTTTWRSNPGWRGTAGFCHIFQLKATNGDSGAPLITLSLRGDKAIVEATPDGPKIIAREFAWQPGTWQTVRIRVRTSPTTDGELQVSVNGDPYVGRTGVALSRPRANTYRPKWGLYRRAAVNAPMGDDYIEHRDISVQTPHATQPDNAALETEARALAKHSGARAAIAWLQSKPQSAARDFAIASLAALWAEREPPAAMAWAEALRRSPLRADAMMRIFSRWADRDVAAAALWLKAHAPDPSMDGLVWLFATDTTYRYVQREIALEAAPLIQDFELRAAAIEHVVEIWARTERAAAIAFVEQSTALTQHQKNAIVKKLQPAGAGVDGPQRVTPGNSP